MSNYSRRRFLESAGAALGAPFLSPLLNAREHHPPEQAPNIVFLFSDDHSVPDLGCYGNSAIQTPHLDQLAADGLRFNRAYVTSPQCSPSRASVLTGRTPHEVSASRLHADVPARQQNVVRLLNDRGYFTGAYRKVHQPNIRRDFNFYADSSDNRSFSTFFEKRPDDRPFFLWFGSRDPHRGYGPGAFAPTHKPKNVKVPDYLPDTPKVRQDLAYYYDEVARFDKECGQIIALLDKHGLTENTMIVMSSDNGLPFPRAKGTLYEAGIHVPLLIKYPKLVEPGRTSNALISLSDLTATWLDVAGIDDNEVQGHSMLPLLAEETESIRNFVYSERNWHDSWDPMRCVVGERFKLIQNYRPEIPYYPSLDIVNSASYKEIERLEQAGKLSGVLRWYEQEQRPQMEFYDLKNDPGEWENLAGNSDQQNHIERYQMKLSKWMQQTNDFLPPPQLAFPGGAESELNRTIDPLDGKERIEA